MKLTNILNEIKINQPNSNYKLVLDVVESYDDEDIMKDFLETFPEGKNISKDEFFEFFTSYVDDTSEYHYIKIHWKYVKSGGDDSVYDELDEIKINSPQSIPLKIYKNYVLLCLEELSNNPIEFKVKVEVAKDWSEIQEAIDEEDFEISDLFDMMSDFISDIVK